MWLVTRKAQYNQLIASGLKCMQNYKHWQQPQLRRGTMFIQEYGMIVIQLLAYDTFLKAKNQMTHVRSLLWKPQACSAYLIFRRNHKKCWWVKGESAERVKKNLLTWNQFQRLFNLWKSDITGPNDSPSIKKTLYRFSKYFLICI